MSLAVVTSPRNHFKLLYQIARKGRPKRAAFLRSGAPVTSTGVVMAIKVPRIENGYPIGVSG